MLNNILQGIGIGIGFGLVYGIVIIALSIGNFYISKNYQNELQNLMTTLNQDKRKYDAKIADDSNKFHL